MKNKYKVISRLAGNSNLLMQTDLHKNQESPGATSFYATITNSNNSYNICYFGDLSNKNTLIDITVDPVNAKLECECN